MGLPSTKYVRKSYSKVQSQQPRPRPKILGTTSYTQCKVEWRQDRLMSTDTCLSLPLVSVCLSWLLRFTWFLGSLRCVAPESQDSIDGEFNSENSLQLRLCFLFQPSVFSFVIETRCTAHCHSTVCKCKPWPTEQVAAALTDSFSRGYDPYTHACKARPLTTVRRISVSVIVITYLREQRITHQRHVGIMWAFFFFFSNMSHRNNLSKCKSKARRVVCDFRELHYVCTCCYMYEVLIHTIMSNVFEILEMHVESKATGTRTTPSTLTPDVHTRLSRFIGGTDTFSSAEHSTNTLETNLCDVVLEVLGCSYRRCALPCTDTHV